MATVGRYTGTVKSFKDSWGFLTAEGVDGDVFIHAKDCPGLTAPSARLRVGETIEFDLSAGGPNNQARAVNATRMDPDIGGGNGAPALTGHVKSFRRGWGLIESPSLEGPLYFGERDNPNCKEGTLMPGDEVTFEVALNPTDGRNKAINVQVPMKDQSELVGQRVRGTVKSWQEGWGFAHSPRFMGAILLGRKHVAASGVFLQVGEHVEFEVSLAPSGKYEATNISQVGAMQSWGGVPPPPRGPAPLALTNGGWPGAGGAGATARDRSRTPHGAAAQGQYTGTVKTFRDGWGFLLCNDVPGDIYMKSLNSPHLGQPLQPGEAVSFDLVWRNEQSEKNNGATAVNVQRLGGGGGGGGGAMAVVPATVPGAVKQVGPVGPRTIAPPRPQWGGGGAAAAPAAVKGGVSQHTGTVAVFKPPPDAWGWLESPTCDGQVFLGLRDNPQLQSVPNVGDTLVFELGAGPKGRSKAINASPSMVGQRTQGVVTNLYNGWGFATVEGIQGKVMVGKNALSASGMDVSMLQAGEAVEFDLNMAAKGYEAVNIKKL